MTSKTSARCLWKPMRMACACSSRKPLILKRKNGARCLCRAVRLSCACSSRNPLIFHDVDARALSPHTPMRPNGPLGRSWGRSCDTIGTTSHLIGSPSVDCLTSGGMCAFPRAIGDATARGSNFRSGTLNFWDFLSSQPRSSTARPASIAALHCVRGLMPSTLPGTCSRVGGRERPRIPAPGGVSPKSGRLGRFYRTGSHPQVFFLCRNSQWQPFSGQKLKRANVLRQCTRVPGGDQVGTAVAQLNHKYWRLK